VGEEHARGAADEAKGASKGGVDVTDGEDKDDKRAQAEAQSDIEPFDSGPGALPELRKASEDLKAKIAEAKRRNDIPLDSALGNPDWERSVADGHVDLPDDEDD
jgi:hypothetical protein